MSWAELICIKVPQEKKKKVGKINNAQKETDAFLFKINDKYFEK